jgi:hypothetical protein
MTRAVVARVASVDMAKASATFSTLRQLGGALGVAAMGAAFTAAGGYGSPETFADGARPAFWVGALFAGAATAAALALPRAHRPAATPLTTETAGARP